MVENEGIADDEINEIMNQVLYGHKDKYREEIRNILEQIGKTQLLAILKGIDYEYDESRHQFV